jgi:hypothetical protein
MGDSASKALKEYEQILTGGSGKMGRNLNKDFSSWNDQDSSAIRVYEQPVACLLLVVAHHLVALKILKHI